MNILQSLAPGELSQWTPAGLWATFFDNTKKSKYPSVVSKKITKQTNKTKQINNKNNKKKKLAYSGSLPMFIRVKMLQIVGHTSRESITICTPVQFRIVMYKIYICTTFTWRWRRCFRRFGSWNFLVIWIWWITMFLLKY